MYGTYTFTNYSYVNAAPIDHRMREGRSTRSVGAGGKRFSFQC